MTQEEIKIYNLTLMFNYMLNNNAKIRDSIKPVNISEKDWKLKLTKE